MKPKVVMIAEKTISAGAPARLYNSKKIISDSHSWDIQAWPARVKEKGSEWGMLWDSTIHWPVRRCHQRSGSMALRAVIASRPKRRIAAKGISVLWSEWKIRRIAGGD